MRCESERKLGQEKSVLGVLDYGFRREERDEKRQGGCEWSGWMKRVMCGSAARGKV